MDEEQNHIDQPTLQQQQAEIFQKRFLLRAYGFYLLFVALGLLGFGKTIYIMTIEGTSLRKKMAQNQIKYGEIKPLRGNILAKDGSLLASSVPIYDLRMDAANKNIADTTFNKKIDSLSMQLANLFGDKSAQQYKKLITQARMEKRHYVLIKRNIDHFKAMKLKTFALFRHGQNKGGIILVEKSRRKMPYGILAYRTIGYVNKEANAETGIESAYNSYLEGVTGRMWLQKISGGDWIPLNEKDRIDPKNGSDVVTTIDIELQDVAESALKRHLQDHNAESGCVIVMEVATGAIRAIANLGQQKDGSYQEDYNYAIGTASEPGSTFKLASLMVALEDGFVKLEDSVKVGDGVASFFDLPIKDSHPMSKKTATVLEAFAASSNVGISRVIFKAYKHDNQRFVSSLKGLGLGEKLGIDLKGEGAPFINAPNEKSWSRASVPFMSIGYEVKLTPLQTLTFYNAVANNGIMVKPMFVQEIRESGSTKSFSPVILNKSVSSKSTIKQAHILLEEVVKSGTARGAFDGAAYTVAGKTGTAQIVTNRQYDKKNYSASFVGYFPADDPLYSCIVVVRRPKSGQIYGATVAAPVFREVADKLYATNISLKDEKIADADDTLTSQEKEARRKAPLLTSANFKDLEIIMDHFDFEEDTGSQQADWVLIKPNGNKLKYTPQKQGERIIPDVKGMTARDAVFLLEQRGLKVKLNGRGKVKSQSLNPGQKANQGDRIVLDLQFT